MIEIAIAVFILLLLMALAVPSLSGVMADRRLRRSFDALNNFVQSAQERSVNEHRAYLISWDKGQLALHPEEPVKEDQDAKISGLPIRKGEAFTLQFPAALIDDPPADWVFWPSGTCEPAVITFKGPDGTWTARYSILTARAELLNYAAR